MKLLECFFLMEKKIKDKNIATAVYNLSLFVNFMGFALHNVALNLLFKLFKQKYPFF